MMTLDDCIARLQQIREEAGCGDIYVQQETWEVGNIELCSMEDDHQKIQWVEFFPDYNKNIKER